MYRKLINGQAFYELIGERTGQDAHVGAEIIFDHLILQQYQQDLADGVPIHMTEEAAKYIQHKINMANIGGN